LLSGCLAGLCLALQGLSVASHDGVSIESESLFPRIYKPVTGPVVHDTTGLLGEEFWSLFAGLPVHPDGPFVIPRGIVVANFPPNTGAHHLARWFARTHRSRQAEALAQFATSGNQFPFLSAPAFGPSPVFFVKGEASLTIVCSGPRVGMIGDTLVARPITRSRNVLDAEVVIRRDAVVTTNVGPYWPIAEIPLGHVEPGCYEVRVQWLVEPLDPRVPHEEPLVYRCVVAVR